MYNTSADARAMLCHKNPVKTCKGKTVHKTRGEKVICDTEVLADEYKARTLPDPQIQGWLDAFADSAATLLLKVEPHVPEKWRAWLPLIARPTASQDAYDKIVCGITKNGLPATLFSMWLWPLHWVIDVVVKVGGKQQRQQGSYSNVPTGVWVGGGRQVFPTYLLLKFEGRERDPGFTLLDLYLTSVMGEFMSRGATLAKLYLRPQQNSITCQPVLVAAAVDDVVVLPPFLFPF